MAIKISRDLSDFVVTENVPDNLVKSPSFLNGRFGQSIYDAYQQGRDSTYNGNPNLRLQLQDGVVTGSNFFDAVLINQLLRQGNVQGNPRTPLPADLSNPEVLEMVRGKYYIDSQALVLRGTTDSYNSKNDPLARFLAEQEGVDLSRLEREPALIYGFDLKLDESKEGYGLLVVPSDNFTVHHDDRLNNKWNGYRFNNVDEMGLPTNLDKNKGSRTFYTRDSGLSRLDLGRGLDLGSGWNDLGNSDSDGRVVVLSGEATAPKKEQ